MSQSSMLYVGFAVPHESMAVASIAQEHGAEVTALGAIGTRQCDLDHGIRKRPYQATPRVFGSEAGPCGAWRSRDCRKQGHTCWVVAPSLLPTKASDRGNTDRRDAGHLARLRRSGALTPGSLPQEADEARRDLTRAREDVIGDLKAATCRLNACGLRPDSRDTGRAPWNPAPLRGLSEVVCATPAPPRVFQADVRAVTEHPKRLHRLEQARQAHVKPWRGTPVVEALQALRGVPCTVAVITGAARGDLTRVDPPKALMTCLGLTPAEDSSGARRRQGSLTHAGNPHARRVLVEGAWASRSPAKGSRHWQRRRERPPKSLQASSWNTHVRRCPRDRRLMARGKPAHQVVVAVARQLVGFIWALAPRVPGTPSAPKTTDHCPADFAGVPPGGAEAPPRYGAILDGVRRLQINPRAERAPGTRRRPGRGPQPTAISRLNRRV